MKMTGALLCFTLLAGSDVAAAQLGGNSNSIGRVAYKHAYYLFLDGTGEGCERCYVPLLIAQDSLEATARGKDTAQCVLVITYERDSLWEFNGTVPVAPAGIQAAPRVVRVNGKSYRYQEISPSEVLKLLTEPAGSIPVSRAARPDTVVAGATMRNLVADFRALLPAGCATVRLPATFWGLRIRERVEPEYPAEAKQKGLSGRVSVQILINEKGDVEEARARSGPEALRTAAEAAALQWKFPAVTAGREARYFDETLTFDFVLDGPNATIAVTEPFAVRWNDLGVVRLQVPSGFKIESHNYKEGILTTLSYADGSRLLLDPGGMYPISHLFHDPAYESVPSVNLGPRVTRWVQSPARTCIGERTAALAGS